jgi:spore germination protein GerM
LSVIRVILKTIVFFTVAVFLLSTGCFQPTGPVAEILPEEKEQETPQEKNPSGKINAVLYFATEDEDKLAREDRIIEAIEGDISKLILEELIKGPHSPALNRTVPAGVKVLGVSVNGGIASIDFSEEIRSGHWGGSTGEILTVYSIVNTLAELPEIEMARFLIEGEEIETLAGHLDLSEPVYPDEGLIKN